MRDASCRRRCPSQVQAMLSQQRWSCSLPADVHFNPCAGIIVGTVPEGLLVTLTVSLALSAKNM